MEEKTKINGQGKISMSLYEINQNIISQLPSYDNGRLEDLRKRINDWSVNHRKYFMLLCKDISYYTVLRHDTHQHVDFRDFGQAIIGLLTERGYKIHSDEILKDHCEIWAKDDDNVYAFMLFPYD